MPMEAVEHCVASSLAKVEPPILARTLEAIRSSSLDCSPLPAGEEAVDKEHNDGANHRTDQARAFSGPVPSERLAEITRHEGADDAQDGGEDEARGLVISRHDKFGKHAGDETNDDRPKYTHFDAPFLIVTTPRHFMLRANGRPACICRRLPEARATISQGFPLATARSAVPVGPERVSRSPVSIPAERHP